jgi:tRNA (Thr-GGU) A37 N-methylase
MDVGGFERLWPIYWLDRAGPFQERVRPCRDNREHGRFATRSPCQPNPIGMSAVRLLGRQGGLLRVADLDILDGTPK